MCGACEQVLNQHPKVYRSALVSGAERIVAVLELEKGHRLNAKCESELRQLCTDAQLDVCIDGFVQHGGFPVDIRHNAKIDRKVLGEWVRGRSA